MSLEHHIYTVTTELFTPWWLKVLRFLRLKPKRVEFSVLFRHAFFQEDCILDLTQGKVKILKKIMY